MSDFDKPTTTGSQYTQVLPELRANIKGVAIMDYTGFQGIPNGAVKFSAGELSKYNGSSFYVVPISVSGGGTGSTTASGARVNLGVISETESDSRYLAKAQNLSGLTDKSIARTNLNVLEAGTGSGQARTNSQNDARFIKTSDEATSTEMQNGTNGKFPDAATVKGYVDGEIPNYLPYIQSDSVAFSSASVNMNYSVSRNIIKAIKIWFEHNGKNQFIVIPLASYNNAYPMRVPIIVDNGSGYSSSSLYFKIDPNSTADHVISIRVQETYDLIASASTIKRVYAYY